MRRFVQAFSAGTGLPADLRPPLCAALAAAPDRYNLAARQPARVLWRDAGGALGADDMTWGLVPRWSKTATTPYTTVTSRLERVARSRVSRHAWQERQRCVLPLNGYYKWDRSRKPYRPWFVHAHDGEMLMAAGLWESRDEHDARSCSFTVLTRENAAIPAPLVPDGPVFLRADDWRRWLEGAGWFPQAFLQRAPQPALAAYPVSRAVQDVARDDYTLLEPVPVAESGSPVRHAQDEDDDADD
jgi:putative SOS response-associated peptidase YedK